MHTNLYALINISLYDLKKIQIYIVLFCLKHREHNESQFPYSNVIFLNSKFADDKYFHAAFTKAL